MPLDLIRIDAANLLRHRPPGAEKTNEMMRHDPVGEIEMSARSWSAMDRESDHLLMEIHRRVIDARVEARRLSLDRLLGRIDVLISPA